MPAKAAYAIAYAQRGIHVFPAIAGAKRPLHSGWQQEATTDQAAIKELWGVAPLSNIGVACGRASNLTVLDVDGIVGRDRLRELEREHGELPDCPVVLTPNGGEHRYFKFEHRVGNAVRFDTGLDVRSQGGLVIGVGSETEKGRYLFEASASLADIEPPEMPEWLVQCILKRQNHSGKENGFKIPEQPVYEGQGRNDLIFRSGRSMKATRFSEDAIRAALEATNRQRCKPPLDEREFAAVLKSVLGQPDSAEFRASQAANAEPQPESELGETATPAHPWPAPLEPEAFHGLAGEFVRLIEPHTEADNAALLIQFLVAVGNLAGRIIYRIADGARHGTNLNCVLIGKTGHGRKGSSWAQVQRSFHLVQDLSWIGDRKKGGLISGEGLIWSVRDAIERRVALRENGKITGQYQIETVDPGVEDKRLLVLESEFSKVMVVANREGNTLSQQVRQAWDGETLETLNKSTPIRASNHHISQIGHITDDELLRHLTSTEAANGFANRYLWFLGRRSKLLPRSGNLSDEQLKPIAKAIDRVIAWSKTRPDRPVEFSPDAWALWDEVYPALTSGRPGLLGAMLNRAEAQVLRLSLIYALLDCSDSVEHGHLGAALAVWEYCESSVLHVFGDRLGDPDADAILQALRAHKDGMTRTDIRDVFLRNLSAARIERALGVLLKENLAKFDKVETRGRPAEIWRATRLK
jgi:hypothetical protein